MSPQHPRQMTTARSCLVCHFAQLDLERALQARGGSKISAPQFLQGFVDGALQQDRHLVWEKLFSIEDKGEAAKFCEARLREGFFDDLAGDRPASGEGEAAEEGDIQSMLRNLFSTPAGPAASASASAPSASAPPASAPPSPRGRPTRRRRGGGGPVEIDDPEGPAEPLRPGANFTPFAGKSRRLDETDGAPVDAASPGAVSPGRQGSWALTFSTNLELARRSNQRSKEQARKCYHWNFCARAVKKTTTGTESYSKGRQAGEKRKGQIDGVAGQDPGSSEAHVFFATPSVQEPEPPAALI